MPFEDRALDRPAQSPRPPLDILAVGCIHGAVCLVEPLSFDSRSSRLKDFVGIGKIGGRHTKDVAHTHTYSLKRYDKWTSRALGTHAGTLRLARIVRNNYNFSRTRVIGRWLISRLSVDRTVANQDLHGKRPRFFRASTFYTLRNLSLFSMLCATNRGCYAHK